MADTNTPQNSINEIKRSVMMDYVYMLSVPLAVAVFSYGAVAIINAVISVVTCAVFTVFGKKILKTEFPPKSPHTLVIGLGVALLLPVSSPWWMIVFTAAFAMGICVLPFGIPDNSPFIPSVAALCFATLCWPERVYDYGKIGSSLGKMLLVGNSINDNVIAILEAFVGNVPSAMGTGCILAIFGVLIFIVIRRPKDSIPVFSFILTVCVMAAVFPRVSTGILISIVMEICSGILFFGAVFFLSNPTYAPERVVPKIVWGIVSGVICMVIRYVSPLEEGAGFGFLIACAISDIFDKLPLTRREKKHLRESEPFIDIAEEAPSVVPEEILNEIPDISDEEILNQDEKFIVTIGENSAPDSESFEAIISAENTLSQQDSPFMAGGDHNE